MSRYQCNADQSPGNTESHGAQRIDRFGKSASALGSVTRLPELTPDEPVLLMLVQRLHEACTTSSLRALPRFQAVLPGAERCLHLHPLHRKDTLHRRQCLASGLHGSADVRPQHADRMAEKHD